MITFSNYTVKLMLLSILTFPVLFFSCDKPEKKKSSVEIIANPLSQEVIYKNLIELITLDTSSIKLNDSLAFLILPIQASCPSCRTKVIDSIMKHKNGIAEKHFIVISGNSGRKNMNAYFREQNYELPSKVEKIFYDTTNVAFNKDLYDEKPTFYYACNKKVYKKVASSPYTIRQDLNEFFSSHIENKTN